MGLILKKTDGEQLGPELVLGAADSLLIGKRGEEDGKWWWFNDDKVSEVESDKIDALSGGGKSWSKFCAMFCANQPQAKVTRR